MITYVSLVKRKIKQYFDKEITKVELSNWARELFHKLLSSEEIFVLEKLVIFKMLTTISDNSFSCESRFDETIQQICDVLNGYTNETYVFHMKIPREFKNANVVNIREILIWYKEERILSKTKIEELESFANRTSLYVAKTVNELLETQIISLLFSAFRFYPNDNEIYFKLNSTIFMNDTDFDKEECLSKLLRYIDCCLGEKSFCVQIVYENGIPRVSILI